MVTASRSLCNQQLAGYYAFAKRRHSEALLGGKVTRDAEQFFPPRFPVKRPPFSVPTHPSGPGLADKCGITNFSSES